MFATAALTHFADHGVVAALDALVQRAIDEGWRAVEQRRAGWRRDGPSPEIVSPLTCAA